MVDIFTTAKRSQIMSKIKSKNTSPERMMAKTLRENGFRNFTKGDKIFGKPDFIFGRDRVALFVDGGFWHGHSYNKIKDKLPPFWRKKIAGNIKRDKLVNARLKKEGWKVIRIWDYAIRKNPQKCMRMISVGIR